MFEIRRSFERFVANVALVDQEWLKLRVSALCDKLASALVAMW